MKLDTATEPLDTRHVEDAPIVAVSKPKKSKRASSCNVPKWGSLVDGDTSSPPELSIDNDSSDNVVESSDIPLEPTDCANNVPNDATVHTVPLDEFFDYDDISVQSVPDNKPQHQTLRNVYRAWRYRGGFLLNRPKDANLTWETWWLGVTLGNK